MKSATVDNKQLKRWEPVNMEILGSGNSRASCKPTLFCAGDDNGHDNGSTF